MPATLDVRTTAATIVAVVQGGYVMARATGSSKSFTDATNGLVSVPLRFIGHRASRNQMPLTPQRQASTSTPRRPAKPAQPASVTFTTRLGARSTHPSSANRVSSAAPSQPARWGRCSDQSMQ